MFLSPHAISQWPQLPPLSGVLDRPPLCCHRRRSDVYFFCTVDGVEGVCSHGGRVRERHTRSRRRTPPAAACIPPTLHAGRLWPSALRAPADCLRPLLLSSSTLPRPSATTIDPASSSCLRAHRPPRPQAAVPLHRQAAVPLRSQATLPPRMLPG